MEKKEGLAVFDLIEPQKQAAPIVVACPHSGHVFPEDFLKQTRLDPWMLRRPEDAYVDDLFAEAEMLGIPLLKALFPRTYIDPNREPYELDPVMFDTPLPVYANTQSPRIDAGIGTIPRLVGDSPIYTKRLSFADFKHRLDNYYIPYHQALKNLVEQTKAKFGYVILLDCHSMPSMDLDGAELLPSSAADVVLGDRFGTSCAPALTRTVEELFEKNGIQVVRNRPYAGGYTTQTYGCPSGRVHALQIEINRAIYMDEKTLEAKPSFEAVADMMTHLMQAVACIPRERLTFTEAHPQTEEPF